ncbi:pentatricopeptide repeat-containing protein At4g21880, mitochondrial isoform X8 [Populus trichocarpa]|uniref:pentatricopeptide repeat-containing protein At4g21880, mitochondrial isoform X8 n=1 Tax=Populus trichocarpa TaxID=3694 RepID=UPI000D18B428|nr:pentatricopeptide repeat-containing protein At4g21880, mitochondrial isoform X8 [Populus trichocarpa]|eukprot:XP_024437064.1 pentatricopeptide repeat-containing protein At4g21880, mitochondrial isoform X11 [Populus trichocarpa]
MPKFKILSNLVRAAIKTTTASTTTASDTTFKSLVSHFESITPPKPETSSKSKKQPETKPQSPPSPAVKSSPGALGLEDFYSETIPTAKDMAKTAKVIEKIINENYLLALCESDQKNYLLQLLETVDITKLSLLGNAVSIFKSLGRLSLEYYVEKFLLVLKNCDYGAEDISTLIFSYATSIPNLAVEDVVSKFKTLHTVMEMSPSSTSYERLIVYSCNSLKVHHAIDMVDQLCEEGFTISINTIHSMLNASEASLDFNLFSSLDSTSKTAFCFHVQRIYSLIYHLDLTPTNETFRRMIGLSVKMKDFDGAIGLLNDLKKLNLTPTAGMYNAIMDGYFREKNISGALMVLEQMKLADVKPDSATYSCLISNCDNEDQITKCYEEMKVAGIQVSKQSIYGAH